MNADWVKQIAPLSTVYVLRYCCATSPPSAECVVRDTVVHALNGLGTSRSPECPPPPYLSFAQVDLMFGIGSQAVSAAPASAAPAPSPSPPATAAAAAAAAALDSSAGGGGRSRAGSTTSTSSASAAASGNRLGQVGVT